MPGARRWDNRTFERLAVAGLLLAMVAAAALLIWESRGLTILVDEWSWGFGSRTDFDLSAFVEPHNGHFAAVMVLITKASLQLFHANAALPLRLLAVALHLATAGCLFLLMRQTVGTVGAVIPTVLVLFLGAANDGIVGSHGMSVTITVLTGLAAWLALQRRKPIWDVAAASLLTVGVAAESTALPFVLGAAVLIALDRESPRSRYWIVVTPLAVYALWWLGYGHTEKSDVAIANFAGLPSFAFDSLAVSLGAITGLFTTPGSRVGGFDLSAGQAIAGGFLAVVGALVLQRRYRPGLASAVPLVTLLTFWFLTAGVASPARVPYSSRFIYIDVILLLLVLAQEVQILAIRPRAVFALSAVCAFALLPNIRELTYGADFVREEAETNKAVMGAAELIQGQAPSATLLEDPADVINDQVADLAFPLAQYTASKERFGAPAFSAEEIARAGPEARAAADHLIARGLPIELVPAGGPPGSLPLRPGVSQTGGVLKSINGCLRFAPLAAGAQLSLELPVGGFWMRPATGPPVPIAVKRFADTFSVGEGPALPGRASILDLPASRASSGWSAQLTSDQPLLLCSA